MLAHRADVVLALGTGFCEMETSSWNPEISFRFGHGARLIQVDIDPHEIGRTYPVDVGICGDAGAVVAELLELVGEPAVADRVWIGELRDARAAWEEERDAAADADETPMSTESAMRALAGILPEDAALVCDVGSFRHAVLSYVPLDGPGRWYFPAGLVTMGAACGAALGAKLAVPERPVICLVGDGGFSANGNALATAMEAGIPVVYVVFNNFANDAIRAYQLNHYDGRLYGTEFQAPDGAPYNPDFVKLAEAYGVEATRVTQVDEVAPAIERALASGGPYVVDIVSGTVRPRATGRWEVNAILAAEAAFKRSRLQSRLAAA
jgi:acetolactate synthase-1/2/3 large subunit